MAALQSVNLRVCLSDSVLYAKWPKFRKFINIPTFDHLLQWAPYKLYFFSVQQGAAPNSVLFMMLGLIYSLGIAAFGQLISSLFIPQHSFPLQ